MARFARHGNMRPFQRERSVGVVIERSRLPSRDVVASLAIFRETGGDVVWIHRCVVVLQVAANAGCWQAVENSRLVATDAIHSHVSSRERE